MSIYIPAMAFILGSWLCAFFRDEEQYSVGVMISLSVIFSGVSYAILYQDILWLWAHAMISLDVYPFFLKAAGVISFFLWVAAPFAGVKLIRLYWNWRKKAA